MKGVLFRCPTCEEQARVTALFLKDGDVFLYGVCEACNEQLRFKLSACLMQMIPENNTNRKAMN